MYYCFKTYIYCSRLLPACCLNMDGDPSPKQHGAHGVRLAKRTLMLLLLLPPPLQLLQAA